MPPHTHFVALDLEFIKTRGTIFARSAAFVPFHASTTTSSSSSTPVRRTCFSGQSTVLALSPSASMLMAEALPCGHCLASMMEATFAPHAATLQRIAQPFAREAEESLNDFRQLRRSLREHHKMSSTKAHKNSDDDDADANDLDDADATTTVNAEENTCAVQHTTTTTTSSSSSSSPSTKLLHPVEKRMQREMQLRLAIAKTCIALDPYSLPNIHHVDEHHLALLHTAPADSADFVAASRALSCLRAYGRGRGAQKSLAFITRYHPTFAQMLLRTVFATPQMWLDWLHRCADLVKDDLHASSTVHKDEEASTSSSSSACSYKEFGSLEELSREMNLTWCRYFHLSTPNHIPPSSSSSSISSGRFVRTKCVVYGNADSGVLHNTLQLSCSNTLRRRFPRACAPSEIQVLHNNTAAENVMEQKATTTTTTTSSSSSSSSSSSNFITPVPTTELISPYQARVMDVTAHSLFRASNMCGGEKLMPSLADALQKSSEMGDVSATALRAHQRQHDPLWDAQALACITVACGIAK